MCTWYFPGRKTQSKNSFKSSPFSGGKPWSWHWYAKNALPKQRSKCNGAARGARNERPITTTDVTLVKYYASIIHLIQFSGHCQWQPCPASAATTSSITAAQLDVCLELQLPAPQNLLWASTPQIVSWFSSAHRHWLLSCFFFSHFIFEIGDENLKFWGTHCTTALLQFILHTILHLHCLNLSSWCSIVPPPHPIFPTLPWKRFSI